MASVVLPAFADDTEVYINPATSNAVPNIMMILDLSGSMGDTPEGNDPGTGESSRLDILKDAISGLLNSDLPDINIGLTTFSGSSAHGVHWPALGIEENAHTYDTDIPNNTTVAEAIESMVEATEDGGSTPTVSALHEVARYYRGEAVNAGGVGDFGTWSTSSKSYTGDDDSAPNPIAYTTSGSTHTYDSPITQQCQASTILLLTDGRPTQNDVDEGEVDGGTAESPYLIRDMIAGDLGVSRNSITCEDQSTYWGEAAGDYTEPNCAIELAAHMSSVNQIPSVIGSKVTTNTIGFGLVGAGANENWEYLQRVAAAGDGEAFLANDVTTLVESFKNVIDSLVSGNQSFRNFSATFDVSTLSTGDRAYLSLFRPTRSRAWSGNLKGYFLRHDGLHDINDNAATEVNLDGEVVFKATAKSFWSNVTDGNTPQAGGLISTMSPSSRNIYVITDPTQVANIDLNDGNHNLKNTNGDLTTTLMGMPGGSTSGERTQLIQLARSATMGDPLHTRPEIVNYGGTTGNVLYIATNQGYIHGVDINRPTAVGDTGGGVELFAFMPNELVGTLHAQSQASSSGGHIYGIDGDLTIWRNDKNSDGIINGTDKVYLYFGMRRGGSAYYALDVTNPANPQLLWKIDPTTTGFSKLGQSWSKMKLADVKSGTTEKKVLVFGGGYDPDQDNVGVVRSATGDDQGLGIYIVDAETGALHKSIGPDTSFGVNTSTFADMKYAIPSDIKIVDSDFNGIDDRLYFGDMGGQIWRIDIQESGAFGNANKFKGYKFADFGKDATGPESVFTNRRFFYEPSVARFTNGGNFVFALSIGSGYRAHPLDHLIDDKIFLTYDVNPHVGAPTGTPSALTMGNLYDATSDLINTGTEAQRTQAETDLAATKGWFISLANNEKILSRTRLFRNRVLLTSFQPVTALTSCDVAATTNRLYVLDMKDASGGFPNDSNNDGAIDSYDRSSVITDQALILDEPMIVTYYDPGGPGSDPDDPPRPPSTCAGVYGGAQRMLSLCSAPTKVNWTTLQ